MEDTVYLTFHDNINLQSANRVLDFCAKAILQYKPKKLYFLFSSGGGLVDSGVTLFNYLRGLPQEIIMHNVGSIDSIANVVFLAGSVRYTNVCFSIAWYLVDVPARRCAYLQPNAGNGWPL